MPKQMPRHAPQSHRPAPAPGAAFFAAPHAYDALQRAAQPEAPLSQSDGMILQRTIGNQAVGRLLQRAQSRPAAGPIVQRAGGKEDEDLPKPPSSDGPLLLTDKPWEQIERERNPLHKMARQQVFGEESGGGLPKPALPQGPIALEGYQMNDRGKLEEKPPEPEPFKMPSSDGPLLLTDKPWKEVVRPQTQAARKQRRHEDRDQRAEERTQFLASIRQRVAGVRGTGEHAESEAAGDIESRFDNPNAVAGLGDQGARGQVGGELGALEGSSSTKQASRTQAADVTRRIQEKAARYRQLMARVRQLRQRTVNPNFVKALSFFDASGEKATVDTDLPLLEQTRAKATLRVQALKVFEEGISDPTDNAEIAQATATETHADDVEIAAVPAKADTVEKAIDTADDYGAIKAKKEAVFASYRPAPYRLLPHVEAFLSRRFMTIDSGDKPTVVAAIVQKLSDQHNVPKRVFLKNILGYDLVERAKGRLYLRDVNKLELKKGTKKTQWDVHISVFADTVTAGTQDVTTETKEDIVDTLLASNTVRKKAAHVTLELFPAKEHWRNPHWYRGGPWDIADLADKADEPAGDVEDELEERMDAEIDRAKTQVESVINAGGTKDWPELK